MTDSKSVAMYPLLQEYQRGRAQFQEAKEARKKAVREFRLATNEYQPIAKKHEEQEKAVSSFVKNSQVKTILEAFMYVYLSM